MRRFNLGQEPGAFVVNAQVKSLLDTKGEAGLPAVFADNALLSTGRFPPRDELASWAGLTLATVEAASEPADASAGPCCGGESAPVELTAAPASKCC